MGKNRFEKGTVEWNNQMFLKHSTPYTGLAGIVERLRIKKIISYSNLGRNETVLELGCESGNLLTRLPKVKSLIGYDISPRALREAQRRNYHNDVEFLQGDITKKLPFKKGEFDTIICSETLEHLFRPEVAVKMIHQICNMKTKVIITVPNEKPKLLIKKLLKRIGMMNILFSDIEESKSEWHLQEFSRKKIIRLLAKKFKILKMGTVLGLHVVVKARKR